MYGIGRRSIALVEQAMPSTGAMACRWLAAVVLCLFGAAAWARMEPVGQAPLPGTLPTASGAEANASGSSTIRSFGGLDAAAQGAWMLARMASGMLATMGDAQLLALFNAMSPKGFIAYMRDGIEPLHSYQFEMIRRERHNGRWPREPDHMLIRYEETPRRVYARWLADGAHAGQEILYDESRDPTHVSGHFGGMLRFVAGSFPLDGTIAHLQSKHSVRDLGLQFMVRTLEHDLRSYQAEGLSARPAQIELTHQHSERLVALTWVAPHGPPAHYATRVRIVLDLRHPWPREESAWDQNGVLQESIRFEHVAARNRANATITLDNAERGYGRPVGARPGSFACVSNRSALR